MAANANTYFADTARDWKMLREHGFVGWPDEAELTRYACGLEDGLMALARALGMSLTRGDRGTWAAAKEGRARRSG